MSVPFVAVGAVLFTVGAVHARRHGTAGRYVAAAGVTTGVLLVLTAVFDNVMMAAGFFDYGREEISGVRIGTVPAEDFLYPLAGALVLSGVWQMLGGSRQSKGHTDD